MRSFEFSQASDVAEAIRSAGAHTGARYIAGGTTLLDLMKLEVETPPAVIDINRLSQQAPELSKIESLPNGGLRVGALVRNSDLAWDPKVQAQLSGPL
jgi:xanthine dehydrogenase YagS FAD-binding subunit